MKSHRTFLLVTWLTIVSLILAACAGQATPAPAPTDAPVVAEATEAPAPEEEPAEAEATAEPEVGEEAEATEETEPAAEVEPTATNLATATPPPPPTPTAIAGRTQVRWFIGLGAGSNAEQYEAQLAVVEEFNQSQDEIQLVPEIVGNAVAYDTLTTEIASGNPPDIVGPVGVRGSNAFSGLWMDLDPLIEESGFDVSIWEPATVDFYRVEGEGLIGLPFGVFPSFVMYNRDLFDEADLPYPPHAVGEEYDGKEWNVETFEEIAKVLTVDANGNDATSPDFDPENIVQFGFVPQWTDARGAATLFGAGSFVDEEGNAQIPENWREAYDWYYRGMWEDWFTPNAAYSGSDLLGAGNPFASGNVAMAFTHLWYTCCLGDVENWDIGVVPSYNGTTTAKLHADTFRILKGSQNPEAAFEVLTYLVTEAAPELLEIYGGMPARVEDQQAFFDALDETYTQGVDWQVAIDMLGYPDNPSHEGNMPNFQEADDRIGQFWTLFQGEAGLDLDAELETLRSDLQAIFEREAEREE